MTAPRWDDVSRETRERLETYEILLRKWTGAINLISQDSLRDLRVRHFEDSSQVSDLAPTAGRWCDLGSGAGFPAMVAAILSRELYPERSFILVESDKRKAAFLRSVARETDTPCVVHADRIENLAPLGAQILTARALAELDVLLEYAHRHLLATGVAIFPKGASWKKELEGAQLRWSFVCHAITSRTNPEAAILKISGINRV